MHEYPSGLRAQSAKLSFRWFESNFVLNYENKSERLVKAMRKGLRDEEMSILGPGFHSKNKVHKSKKLYSRKKLKNLALEVNF